MISEESAQNYSFLNQELYRFLIFQHFCAFFLWKKYFLRKIKLFSLPIYLYENPVYSPLLRPISTQEKFPRTENFPNIFRKFFPTENLRRPIRFYKIFLSAENFPEWKYGLLNTKMENWMLKIASQVIFR
jgi:hypothetical protein